MTTPLPENVAALCEQLFARRPDLNPARAALIDSFGAIADVFANHGILYLCGNGGSFADAIHIKGELAKSFTTPRPLTDPAVIARLKESDVGPELIDNLEQALPVVVLGESHSLRSAYANDRDPVYSYAQELNAFAAHVSPGILLAISTSGNAANVIAAAALARAYQLTTIAFTGPDGGRLAELADIPLRTPATPPTTWLIQENQQTLYHALCLMIEAYFGAL